MWTNEAENELLTWKNVFNATLIGKLTWISSAKQYFPKADPKDKL